MFFFHFFPLLLFFFITFYGHPVGWKKGQQNQFYLLQVRNSATRSVLFPGKYFLFYWNFEFKFFAGSRHYYHLLLPLTNSGWNLFYNFYIFFHFHRIEKKKNNMAWISMKALESTCHFPKIPKYICHSFVCTLTIENSY